MEHNIDPQVLSRAQGCMIGQIAGDSLGSLVEFMSPERIRGLYPGGVKNLEDGGVWGTLAGQPTDDSEMALCLARTLCRDGTYNAENVKESYLYWLSTGPFDIGNTTKSGLAGNHVYESQANGALMRISPLGIFCAGLGLDKAELWARQDALITHPHEICLDINAVFVKTIASAIAGKLDKSAMYDAVLQFSGECGRVVADIVKKAAKKHPADYMTNQGWVVTAFHNAVYQLVNAGDFRSGVEETVMMGGDTDTNAAIAGALLGACYGIESVPLQWVEAILSCRPSFCYGNVTKPRPEYFWPVDSKNLSLLLLHNSHLC